MQIPPFFDYLAKPPLNLGHGSIITIITIMILYYYHYYYFWYVNVIAYLCLKCLFNLC